MLDEERRVDYLRVLRERLREAGFRRVEGFPLGQEGDILALSDPPYYTACPNPFIREFVDWHGKPRESATLRNVQPYQGRLRPQSRHPVCGFHPYHTKAPPSVIRALIEHYTEPGELVLDPFGGTGMTGVAAREAGRPAIVIDLSPVAGFIAGVNCRTHDGRVAVGLLREIIAQSEKKWGQLYLTEERRHELTVNYYVWSDLFSCPECGYEFPFFPHGVIHHGNKVETRRAFPCPSCGAGLNVRRVERVLGPQGKKKRLAWVNAGEGHARIDREPTVYDLGLAERAEGIEPEAWYPMDPVNPGGYSARLAQLGDKAITDSSRFLSRRNLIVFSDLWRRVSGIADPGTRRLCLATLTSVFTVISERQGYFGGGGGMSGNLYMPIVRMEKNVYAVLRRKLAKLEEAERAKEGLTAPVLVSTQSATDLSALPDGCIDYIYTDPPFGANIIYSEMNQILEAWLQVKTNDGPEAVIDETREKSPGDYDALMRGCFGECYRVLKPGRWMTVEFHNTRARVWNSIQRALGESGFEVAQVGILDKGSTTILADIRPSAARGDLIISAYKPVGGSGNGFTLRVGSKEGAWEFVESYLARLPAPEQGEEGRGRAAPERRAHQLFDRMVAFHVQRGVGVPLSSAEFHAGLRRRFVEREGMFYVTDSLGLKPSS